MLLDFNFYELFIFTPALFLTTHPTPPFLNKRRRGKIIQNAREAITDENKNKFNRNDKLKFVAFGVSATEIKLKLSTEKNWSRVKRASGAGEYFKVLKRVWISIWEWKWIFTQRQANEKWNKNQERKTEFEILSHRQQTAADLHFMSKNNKITSRFNW